MKYIAIALVAFSVVALAQTFPSLEKIQWLSSAPPEGKIQLVEFWATWCPPCRTSIPHLNEIHNKYKEQGLVVIGISDESVEEIQEFQKEIAMEYTVGRDTEGNIGTELNISAIPTAFFVLSGDIVWKGHPSEIQDKLVEEMLQLAIAKGFPGFEKVRWLNAPAGEGKVLLVEFWATSCPICRESIPHLNEIYRKYGNEGLAMASLTKEDEDTVRKFQQEVPMEYAVGIDADGALGTALEVSEIPTAFFVRYGKIIWAGHPKDIGDELIRSFGLRQTGEKDQYDLIVEKIISLMTELADAMGTIQDEATAKAARPGLEGLVQKMKDLEKEIGSIEDPSAEREEQLKQKYEQQLHEAVGRFTSEMTRLATNQELWPHIADIMEKVQ